MMDSYLNSLVGKLFKIIPMKEDESDTLPFYVNSLSIEINGGMITFPLLASNDKYITIANIINCLNKETFAFEIVKREIFKAISLTKKIISSLEDSIDVHVG